MNYLFNSATKILAFLLLILLIIQACKKNDVPKIDTLSTGWKIIYPRDGSYCWMDIKFNDQSTGYLITPNNLFKSVDGGNHWDSVPAGHRMSYPNLNLIPREPTQYWSLFLSNKKIFITTYQNHQKATPYLLVINDDQILDSIKFSDQISSMSFINQDTGYLASRTGFYLSVNGGEKWDLVKSLFLDTLNLPTFSATKFLSSSLGWVGMNDLLFTIANNNVIQTTKIPDSKMDWYSISAPSDLVIFMTGSNGLFRSKDGGKSVTKIELTFATKGYGLINFSDENNGFFSSENKIYKTIDGGISWTSEVELKTGNYITGIDFKNPNLGWACCSNGQVLLLKR